MTNKPRALGTAYETAVARYLNASGFPYCERRALHGNLDKGDLMVAPGIIAECKAWSTYCDSDVAKWWLETAKEKSNANASIALLIIKRHRRPISDSWCWQQDDWGDWNCTYLHLAVRKLRQLGHGEGYET